MLKLILIIYFFLFQVRAEMCNFLEKFLRNYPDTMSFKTAISSRLGPLLLDVQEEKGALEGVASRILEDHNTLFDDV